MPEEKPVAAPRDPNERSIRAFNACGQAVRVRLTIGAKDPEGRVEYRALIGRSWSGVVKSGANPTVPPNDRHLLHTIAAKALALHDVARGECSYPKRKG